MKNPRRFYSPPRCEAQTKKGKRCLCDAEPGKPWCDVHDPYGELARQHPKYQRRMLIGFGLVEPEEIQVPIPGVCIAPRSKGKQCHVPANPGMPWCHLHDPNGTFCQQHPNIQKRMRLFFGLDKPSRIIAEED